MRRLGLVIACYPIKSVCFGGKLGNACGGFMDYRLGCFGIGSFKLVPRFCEIGLNFEWQFVNRIYSAKIPFEIVYESRF